MIFQLNKTLLLKTISLMLFILVGFSPVQATDTEKDPVATVNGAIITRQELTTEVTLAKKRMAAQGQPATEELTKKMGQKILDQLIDMEILRQESQKQDIQITDTAVSEHLERFKAQFQSAEMFEKSLKELNVSEDKLKVKTKTGLAVQKFIEKQVTSKIEISDTDRQEFYNSNPQYFKQAEQVEARHILIKSDPKDEKDAQEKALEKIKQVQEQVKAGKDFATLAKEHSEGPSGKNGGSLGYFGKGQMVKAFEDAAFAMEPGQTSDIIKTRFGYHLITVTGKKAESTTPFEEVKEKIGTHLKQQKSNESVKAYIETLKKDAKIEKLL